MVHRRYEQLRREGYEEAAERLRDPDVVSDFSDQQNEAIRLCNRFLDGWDPRHDLR